MHYEERMREKSEAEFVVNPSLFQIPPENTRYGDSIMKLLEWSHVGWR